MRRDPRELGQARSRWRAADIRRVCDWLRLHTPAGLSQLLKRLHIAYKRGRQHVHSPDADYLEKLLEIQLHLREALVQPESCVLLFEDECSYYRQPTLAQDYAPTGHTQSLAELGHRSNQRERIIGVINALTGATYAEQQRFTGVQEIVAFYCQVCQLYPKAQVIYLVQDNWPVHFHPDVLAALGPQASRWPWHRPESWAKVTPKATRPLNLPIQLLLLPTYASWTNPIEKLWRKLRQEVLHLHRFADDWEGLKQCVGTFLQQFSQGSEELLRYVGLSEPQRLYATAFTKAVQQYPLRR